MAQQTRVYLKAKFNTGDKPQEADFHDWLDSFVHLDEYEVAGSATIAPGGTFVLATGELLEKMLILSATSQNVSVGTSAAGTQVVNAQAIAAGSYYLHTEDFYANGAPVTLYFTCTGNITLKYRKTVFP